MTPPLHRRGLAARRLRRLGLALVVAAGVAAGAQRPGAEPATAAPAWSAPALYDRFCAACHGSEGDGRGPGAPWLWPRPRDFTRGEYKWRTTPSGQPPLLTDLEAAIRYGVPGTSMPGFGDSLDEAQVAALARHLTSLAPAVFIDAAPVTVAIPAPPARTEELIERGQTLYGQFGCVACHGPDGCGAGAAADSLRTADGLPAAPYDLTAAPLRRPRDLEADNAGLVAIYTSLVTGLTGTAMPAYAGAVSDDDLWAVAAYVDSIRAPDAPAAVGVVGPIPDTAVELDRSVGKTKTGYWPGHGNSDERAVFGQTIALQGPAPASLAPAQASLDARRCARCHAKQVREWEGSLHAGAASPGLLAQLTEPLERGATVESCQRCHAPLAEQLPVLRPGHVGKDDRSRSYRKNPRFDPALRHQGINCAGCHVRAWRRLGPPRLPGSNLLALPGYPLTTTPIYERADLCLGCHQLPARQAVNGRPLLDTYREWLQGPYMRRGVQCQHCHMPNREHTWKGIHDPETFLQGISVDAIAGRSAGSGVVSVRARLRNVGAGHYLPTTPTPAVWLQVELIDADGDGIPGAHAQKRIGRLLEFEGQWIEREDTRIPPGQSLELAAAWKQGAVDQATAARVTVRVVPDDYYEGLYRRRLSGSLTAEQRAMFEQALSRAEASRYIAVERDVPVTPLGR
ncbi:c-type cytochrome [Haliangium sp.]|uniref:c-type cytochrome n=1 Tax=Haliangium sp. TaxID=2663208 RepID=UPI003D0EB057